MHQIEELERVDLSFGTATVKDLQEDPEGYEGHILASLAINKERFFLVVSKRDGHASGMNVYTPLYGVDTGKELFKKLYDSIADAMTLVHIGNSAFVDMRDLRYKLANIEQVCNTARIDYVGTDDR